MVNITTYYKNECKRYNKLLLEKEIIAKGEFSELKSEEKDLRYARDFTF